jgi:hypothetical protein
MANNVMLFNAIPTTIHIEPKSDLNRSVLFSSIYLSALLFMSMVL